LDGFGSVFDGVYRGGTFENVSTQAVLEMFKNVDNSEPNFVQIDAQDVDVFDIPRVVEVGGHSGEGWFIFWFDRLLCLYEFFLGAVKMHIFSLLVKIQVRLRDDSCALCFSML
jgi:hypothetical protein